MSVKHYKSSKPTTAPGYYVPAGEVFPWAPAKDSKAKPGEEWEEVKASDAAAMAASQDQVPDDANLEAADKAALQAVAIMKHVDIRNLKTKDDLIDGIKAAYEPRL